MPHRSILSTFILALVLNGVVLDGGLAAQEPETPPPAATDPAPAELASPRATMYTFLVAFDTAKQPSGAADLDQAARCLDLSQIPPGARALEGRQRAVQLKDVLDRTRKVDFETLPDEADGGPYVFYEGPAGTVEIRRQASGAWLFSDSTVAALPRLWQEARARPVAEGVTEAPRTLPLWLRSRIPSSWQRVVFLLEQWQWAGLLFLIGLGFLLSRLVTYVFRRLLSGFFAARVDGVESRTLDRASLPLGIATMALVWGWGIVPLDLSVSVLRVLHQAIWFVGIAALVWLLYRLVDVFTAALGHRASLTAGRFDDLLIPIIRKMLKILVTVFGVVFVADNLEVEIGSLLAGLGLGGLAVALAAQDTVKNLFGSVTVLLDRPFQIGDAISVSGVEGTVEEVGIRSTRIRTFENSLVTLPNAGLISASVDNKGARVYRRWKTALCLTYDTPPAKIDAFCEGVREIVRGNPHTRKEGFYIYLNEFGASSLDVLVYLFFDTQEWQTELQARHDICLAILRLAERMEVEFAFPTRTVVLEGIDTLGNTASGPEGATGSGAEDLREQARRIARELSGQREDSLSDAEA